VCGPCSEIYYHPPGATKSVEIWNLVFTQFNRVGNPPNNLRPLPSKNIDTGMGLERIAAVMQGVDTNYHIDTLRPLVEAAGEVCGVKYDPKDDNGRRLRRIADHVRACTMAIHENVLPGPNREKYVIRRLLRRAVLDGHQMGRREPFLFELAPVVAQMMKAPYPELGDTLDRVAKAIKGEENAFLGTLDAGLAKVESVFGGMKSSGRVVVGGHDAFDLYTTYGIPPELVEQLAAELNYTLDWPAFEEEMKQHGERSGRIADTVFVTGPIDALKKALKETEFLAYQGTEATAEVKGIVAQEHLVDQLTEVGHDKEVIVVLDRTPFYGESGGQVGDTGEIVGPGFKFEVTDSQKNGDLILHIGHLVEGKLTAGAKVTARVDTHRRQGIRRAHSATHLLHYALQQTLGKEAHQQGSKVDDDLLRFDFGNPSAVEGDQLVTIQRDVLQKVSSAAPIEWKFVPLSEARTAGAMMLFGEKYPDPARMVSIGDFSRELCAGTHLDNTKEVEEFEIIAEEAVAAGTRRIVALTGAKAKEHLAKTQAAVDAIAKALVCSPLDAPAKAKALAHRVRDLKKQLAGGGKAPAEAGGQSETVVMPREVTKEQYKSALREMARALNVSPFDAPARVTALLAEVEELEKQIRDRASGDVVTADTLLAGAQKVGNSVVIVAQVPNSNANLLRQLIDQVRKKAASSATFLATTEGPDKVLLVAGVSRDLVEKGASAGNWVKEVAPVVGGGGGGKADLAQAGGKDASKLPAALEAARAYAAKTIK
jgi:alanyl-tRNA synthetase